MYYVGPIGGTSHELFKTPLLALGIINLKRSHGFFFYCLVLDWLLLKNIRLWESLNIKDCFLCYQHSVFWLYGVLSSSIINSLPVPLY